MSPVRRVAAVGGGALLGVMALGACAPSSPDREDTRKWLEREIGFTAAQAGCVTDQVWALGDEGDDIRDELAEQTPDLDEAEEALLTQLVQACTTGN